MKKKILANLMFGKFNPFFQFILSNYRPRRLSILAYHRIYNPSVSDYPFNESTISASSEEFDKQMKFVSKNFNAINFQELKKILESGQNIPKNSLIITFDDGYEDNYQIALPILKKYGLTATVFVSTGYINTSQTFWFEKSVYQIKKMKPGKIVLNSGKLEFQVKEGQRKAVIREISKFLKSIPNQERLEALKELDVQTGIDLSGNDLQLVKPLRWDQVLELDKFGIEIGSHTVTHPILANMSDKDIQWELSESKRILEKKLGKKVISISYPVGGKSAYNQAVIKQVKNCRYKFGISYRQGIITRYEYGVQFELPRIHVETDVSFPWFKANLLLPEVFIG